MAVEDIPEKVVVGILEAKLGTQEMGLDKADWKLVGEGTLALEQVGTQRLVDRVEKTEEGMVDLQAWAASSLRDKVLLDYCYCYLLLDKVREYDSLGSQGTANYSTFSVSDSLSVRQYFPRTFVILNSDDS